MKRRFAVIMAALLIAAMAGCQQSGTSGTSAPSEQSTAQSPADSSVAESAESEISVAESSVVSEATSAESSEEKTDTSAAESSENKSKTESSKPKTEESSKPENSKAETSKTETSKTESSKTETSKTETSKTESSKPESSKAEEPKVTGISIDQSSLSLTSGSTQELNAYILWSNNTSSYQGIQWSSSNTSVATVSSSGYVTAKSAGTATITASYGSYSKSCTVTVKAAQSSQPSGGNGGNGGNGGSGNGGNTSKPSDGGNGGSSGNGSSGNGGTQTQPSTPTITIKYRNDAAIEVGKENYVRPSVYKGNEMLAGAAGNYSITYKSSNTSIATIDSEGCVKGISVGTCTITATYGSSTTSCTLTVKEASSSGNGSYVGNYGTTVADWAHGYSNNQTIVTKATEWYSADGNWYCSNVFPELDERVTVKYIGKYDRMANGHVISNDTAYICILTHANAYNLSQNALSASFTVKDPGYFCINFYKVEVDGRGNLIGNSDWQYDQLRIDVNAHSDGDRYIGSGGGGYVWEWQKEIFKDEFGNQYHAKWDASEHTAFQIKTRKGYTIYECPEIVPIINEYRAKEGKSPLYWYKSDKAKAAALKDINRNLDEFKTAYPEWFNSDGSINWDAFYHTDGVNFGQGCIDNCEWLLEGNSAPHDTYYDDGVAECVTIASMYHVRGVVESLMNSPAHRAYIMKLEGSIYVCHSGGVNGCWDFCLA